MHQLDVLHARFHHVPSERWERARMTIERKWLRDVRLDAAGAAAICQGLVGVRVRVEFDSGQSRCDCAAAQPCEHALALFMTALEGGQTQPPARRPQRGLHGAPDASAPAPVESIPPGFSYVVGIDPHDAARLLLIGAGGASIPENAAEGLRWLWWRREAPALLSGELRTLPQALQILHRENAPATGARRDTSLSSAGALFHQRALGEVVHVKILNPESDAGLLLSRLLAHHDARPFPGAQPPDLWTLQDETAFTAWYFDATLRGARVQPDLTLNPKPLRGVRVQLDAGCLPARLRETEADEVTAVAHPELEALLTRLLSGEPEIDDDNAHVLIPATRVVDVEEGLRAAGADVEYRRLAPPGMRYLQWPEELPEDLLGARPRLRAPFHGALTSEPPGLRPEVELEGYQKTAIAFMLHHNHTCLLADDMGLGKTLESLAAAQYLEGRVLVVCPASAREVWRKEVEKFTFESSAVIGPGDDAQVAFDSDAKYVITGYSNLEAMADDLVPGRFDLVILDESHYVKNAATGRARIVRERLLDIPRRLVVSGTPVMNAPDEMRGQLMFLHPDEWSDGAWFTTRFVEPFNEGSPDVRDAVLKRLRQFLEGVMIRREKKTALPDLPSKTIHWHRLDISGEARIAYVAQEEEFEQFVMQEGVESMSSSKASGKLERLKQAALAAKMRDALAFVRSLLDEGEKVVVFSRYRNALRSLEDELSGYGPVVLTGDTSPENRAEAARRFQDDRTCRVFLGQLVAAGTAITLTTGTHAVFLDLDWNPANHRQAMDRIHRRGQTRPVHVHFFLAVGTVDEDIADALEEKSKMMDALLSPTQVGRADLRGAKRIVGERILQRRETERANIQAV